MCLVDDEHDVNEKMHENHIYGCPVSITQMMVSIGLLVHPSISENLFSKQSTFKTKGFESG